MLVVFRAIQGIGAALLLPGTLSIITVTFPPHERAKAIGLWAGMSGVALALGPTIGGLMVEHLGWQSIFFLNVPIGIIAFFVATRTVRESVSAEERQLDIPGLVLGTAALFSLTYALIEANQKGWSDPLIVSTLVAGGLLVGGVPLLGAPPRPRHDAAAVLPDPGVLGGQHGGVRGVARDVRDVLLPVALHAADPRLHAVPGGRAVPADDADDHRDGAARREVRVDSTARARP